MFNALGERPENQNKVLHVNSFMFLFIFLFLFPPFEVRDSFIDPRSMLKEVLKKWTNGLYS